MQGRLTRLWPTATSFANPFKPATKPFDGLGSFCCKILCLARIRLQIVKLDAWLIGIDSFRLPTDPTSALT